MFCNDAISTIYIQPRTFIIIPTLCECTSLAKPYVFWEYLLECLYISSCLSSFSIYSFLFFFDDSSCFSSWSVVICRQETGRFRQEDHHLNSWRSSSILKSPKLCFNNSILHHSSKKFCANFLFRFGGAYYILLYLLCLVKYVE